MFKKFIFVVLSLLFGIGLLYIAFEKIGYQDIVSTISVLNYAQLILILCIFIFILIIGTFRWNIALKTQHIKHISFFNILTAKTIGHSINYLTPISLIGGQSFKAVILKEKAKIPLEKIIISIFIEEFIFLFVVFLFIISGIIFLFTHWTLPYIFNLFLFLALLVFIISFYFIYFKIIKKTKDKKGFFVFFVELLRLDKIKMINGVKDNIAYIEDEIALFFKHQKIKTIEIALLSIIEMLLLLSSYALTIFFLKQELGIGQIFSVNALIHLVSCVPIPASLGSFEWSQVFIFSIFGLSASSAIGFALIIRIVNLIIALFGIILLFHFQIKTIFKKIFGK
ncbi:MAG: flippase-like domain-containing protein [Patescibacteria group bacterium]|nr:flippase-like domain-containing protein [Patescibacteria group bacterium]